MCDVWVVCRGVSKRSVHLVQMPGVAAAADLDSDLDGGIAVCAW